MKAPEAENTQLEHLLAYAMPDNARPEDINLNKRRGRPSDKRLREVSEPAGSQLSEKARCPPEGQDFSPKAPHR